MDSRMPRITIVNAVLYISLSILKKRLAGLEDQNWDTILNRAQRNLDRLLEMQYQIEDILRKKDYKIYYMLSSLLDACSDELEVLISDNVEEKDLISRLRQHIEALFGPQDSRSQEIKLDQYVEKRIETLQPRFAHRNWRVIKRLSDVPPIWIPPDVLGKVVDGLIRNAVENTPDSGIITVSVKSGEIGPELEVKDTGIGMSEENQKLLFENYFTAYDTMKYSSRNPFDFRAGGKGFDLLRMRIFSERYHFELKMHSRRCGIIPDDADTCPGAIEECVPAVHPQDCLESGGTTVTVQFFPADRFQKQ